MLKLGFATIETTAALDAAPVEHSLADEWIARSWRGYPRKHMQNSMNVNYFLDELGLNIFEACEK